MATVKDIPSHDFIKALAAHWKKNGEFEVPDWTIFYKTAPHKESTPQNPDWYYVRAASIARKIYLRGGVGVGAFTKVYGSRARNGTNANHFERASKGLIHNVLKALGEKEIIAVKAGKKGRWITSKGRKELDTIANQVPQGQKLAQLIA